MQPYPQPPAQNVAPRRPWWLIFGLSFGVGLGLILIILSYVVRALIDKNGFSFDDPATFAFDDLLRGIASTLVFLFYFSACLIAGVLVAGKTRKAGSATLASLLIGLFFLFSSFIFRISVFPFVSLLVFPLGIYVGFLGGLIGRTTEKTRKTIGIFYAIGIVLVGTALSMLLFIGDDSLASYYQSIQNVQDILLSIYISILIIGSLSGIVAWIMTLIQFIRVQAWGLFTLAFFFSGIMILVYLIVGAQPSQPVQYVVLAPGAYPYQPPIAGVNPPIQPVPAQPPQADALVILKQRFARGEIDAATYQYMRKLLES